MDDEHNDIDDWFGEPNADAYIKTEERTGPPLDYIAEKMRRCIESCHFLTTTLDESKVSSPLQADVFNLSSHASVAFRSQVVAYLALKNMFALINDGELFDRLERYSREEFTEWLDRIDQEGSVTG